MVQVVITHRNTALEPYPTAGPSVSGGSGTPQIQIHFIERNVFGNGIGIRVYGEMKIASGEFVWAREMKLNTVQVLLLTPEPPRPMGAHSGFIASKHIWHKGEYNNYASIMIILDDGTWEGPGVAPQDGSLWLDFEALGEE